MQSLIQDQVAAATDTEKIPRLLFFYNLFQLIWMDFKPWDIIFPMSSGSRLSETKNK